MKKDSFYKERLLHENMSKKDTCLESFQPLWNKIIVEQIDQPESETIIIPEQSRSKSCVGIVLKTGKGDVDEKGNYLPREVNEGDYILFREMAGVPIFLKRNGKKKKFLIMRMDQIYGVFE